MDLSLNSKLVVDVVDSNTSSNKDFGSVISHCRQLLRTQFTNFKIDFNRRQANEVTHE